MTATTKVDVLFVQDSLRSISSPIGFSVDTLNALKNTVRKITGCGKTVGYANLVQKQMPKGKKPCKKDIAGCEKYFTHLLKRREPEFVIPLGSTVTKYLTGKSRFKEWAGRKLTVGEYKVIPIYHPENSKTSKQRQREYETYLANIVHQVDESRIVTKTDYKLIMDPEKIADTLYWLAGKNDVLQSFDYETTGIDPHDNLPVCLSISYTPHQAFCLYFFDIDEYRSKRTNSKLTDDIKSAIKYWLQSSVPKIAQNAKFESKWSVVHFGSEPNNIVLDTKQINHLINEDVSSRLTDLAYQYTDMGGYDTKMQEWLDEGHEHWEAEPNFMLPYSAGDSDCTRQIAVKQLKEMDDIKWLYNNIVHPAMVCLSRVELRGMKVDYERVYQVKTLLEKSIKKIQNAIANEKEVIRTLNHFKKKNKKLEAINLNSTPQMQWLLYTELKLPMYNQSKKTGLPSTDAGTLELLKDKHHIVKKIVQLRSYTYQLTDLQQLIDKRRKHDDTIYSDLVQDYVVTGRLASRNPNLQNIKGSTDEEPSYVKECFISRYKKGLLLQADYKQLELRLMGSESREPLFIKAFEEEADLHQLTADDLNVSRTFAKRINFGSAYGITEHGLCKQLGVTVKEAKIMLENYWNVYTSLKQWMKKNQHECYNQLYVNNRFGRIRHLSDIISNKWWLRESAERQSSNFKIQSLGADINMWVMVQIDKYLMESGMKSMVVGQIHDSVLVDVHPSEIDKVKDTMYKIMEDKTWDLFTFLTIPLKIDIETGDRWSNLTKE